MIARLVLVVIALVSACVETHYRCTKQEECNVVEDPRCELPPDGRCTVRSTKTTCISGREYAPLSDNAGVCYVDNVDPLDGCADGQAPARGDTRCFREVCERIPACCEVGWSTACVLEAQITRACDLRCTTRLAITIRSGQAAEVWTSETLDGTTWSTAIREDAIAASWLAPVRGETLPRLARIKFPFPAVAPFTATLEVGDRSIALAPDREYDQVVSIDLARDARDYIAIGSSSPNGQVHTMDLAIGLPHPRDTPGGRLATGDSDHDGLPDAVGHNNTGGYIVLDNRLDGENRALIRGFSPNPSLATNSMTGQTPRMLLDVRSMDWTDLDGDKSLDLLAVGSEIRAHFAGAGIVGDTPAVALDCDPPSSGNTDLACKTAVSWTATSRPTRDEMRVVFATFPTPTLREASISPISSELEASRTIENGDCGTGCEWIAIASRDVDGDHDLDLILVDKNVNVYVGLAANQLVPKLAFHPETTLVNQTNIRLSITGVQVSP